MGTLKNYFSVVDLLVYIFLFFLFNLVGSLVGHKLIAIFGADYGVENITKLSYIPTFLMIVIVSLIYRYLRCHDKFSSYRKVERGKLSPNFILLGVVFMVAISVVLDPFSRFFEQDMSEYVKMFTTGNMWVTLFVTVLVAPVLEEIFFRGILLRDISICWGSRWGIIVSSLIFSALHFNLVQAIPAFLMGMVMGYVYIRTNKGLVNVIIIHIINNLMASVSLYWGFGEVSIWQRYLPDGFWQKAIFGISAVLVMLLIVRVVTLTNKKKEQNV